MIFFFLSMDLVVVLVYQCWAVREKVHFPVNIIVILQQSVPFTSYRICFVVSLPFSFVTIEFLIQSYSSQLVSPDAAKSARRRQNQHSRLPLAVSDWTTVRSDSQSYRDILRRQDQLAVHSTRARPVIGSEALRAS